MRRDLGDWQTPPSLVREVVATLRRDGYTWRRVLEPTCGTGSFIEGTLSDDGPDEIIGIDIQPNHLSEARLRFPDTTSTSLKLVHADIFDTNLKRDLNWTTNGPLLVVGNPPWVTNAELGTLGSDNLPAKSNLSGLNGLEAITGSANFDIAEFITIKLLTELQQENIILALLVKTSVARRVLAHARHSGLPVEQAALYRIDAQASFGAAVDACLFVVRLDSQKLDTTFPDIPVYGSLSTAEPETVMGFVGQDLIPDMATYRTVSYAHGTSPLEWRQGIKHDAASVMELVVKDGRLENRLGEVVEVENGFIYPLIKSTALFKGMVNDIATRVIVTQQTLGENTASLATRAPRLWAYLEGHAAAFQKRRSSIYNNKPPYSMFGVGDYTFSRFKVAISGLHKEPKFRFLAPSGGRPVLLDDTCYLLGCTTPEQAALLTALLNANHSRALLRSLMFPDSKRPITKKLLQRLDLRALLEAADRDRIRDQANALLDQSSLTEHRVRDTDLATAVPEVNQMSLLIKA